jgi:hypothetical protein
LVCTAAEAEYSGGTGEPNDPYQIGSGGDLLALASDTNDYGKCFILTADVNLAGQVWTTAIIAPDTSSDYGFQGTAFTGTFDGNGHKITNFTVNGGSNSFLGLFGYIDAGGLVKNLGLEDLAVSGSSYFIGGLVGFNGGSISDCYSTGTVSGAGYVGGLTGYNAGSISQCYATGTVSGTSYCVGGLVGSNGGSISNCNSTGAVSGGDGSHYLGGLVGSNGGSISNCHSTGTVSGSAYYVGGLVGGNGGGISNCYSTGAVTGGDESVYIGGLVGLNYGSISDCYSTSTVSGSSWSEYIGGLVGFNNEGGTITNCYSIGSVSGTDYVGGLVGWNDGIVSSSYFLITSGPNNGYGTPLTDAQMKQQSNFVGWDFTNETANGTNDYWRMCVDGVNYPHLNWESMAGDFACPDGVNMEDLSCFVERWLLSDCASSNNCGGADMDSSGTVDFADFAMFAENWMEGTGP